MTTRADTSSVRTRRPAPRVRTVLLAPVLPVLLLLGAVACGDDSSGRGSSGLPPAFADAVATMQEAGGYSFTASIASGSTPRPVTVTGTFSAPNLVAQTVVGTGAAPVSMVLEGGTVHLKDSSSGAWTTQASTTAGAIDLRQAFAALDGAKGVKVEGSTATFTVGGEAARTLVGAAVDGDATVSITLGPVGLSRLTYEATVDGRPVTVRLDYADVGTAPKVVVPA